MFKRYKDKIHKRIDERVNEYCYHDLQPTDVQPVQKKHTAPYNFRCYWNACDYAYNNAHYDVIMGLHRNNRIRHVSLHFWVGNRKTGKSYDPSIGYMASHTKYWAIKTIPVRDWDIIEDVFSDALDYYKHMLTTPWERFVIGKDRIV